MKKNSFQAYVSDFGQEATVGHALCWQSDDSGHTGVYCAAEDAQISVWDGGFNRGIAVFDVIPMWKGWIRKFDSHIDRFYGNLHACRMKITISKKELRSQVLETVRKSELDSSMIWTVATWGPEPILVKGSKEPGGLSHKINLQIWAVPYRFVYPPKSLKEGVKIIIPKIHAIPHECIDPRIKHLNRFHFYLAQLEVIDAGVDGFVLLTKDGYISEGVGSNIWLIKKGGLFTPPDCLQGITRESVFELAKDMNIEATTSLLVPWDLYTADEAFFCSSAGGIFPIVEVDSRTIGKGKPGPITERLIEGYWKLHADPKYCTQV